jgi:hypothetical protein
LYIGMPRLETTRRVSVLPSLASDSDQPLLELFDRGPLLIRICCSNYVALQFSYVNEIVDSIFGPRTLSLFSNVCLNVFVLPSLNTYSSLSNVIPSFI